MTTNTVVVPTNGVEGNLTSCKIETAKISVEKEGVFSFTQQVTHRSYDVCSKEIIREYTVTDFTIWPFILFFGMFFIFIIGVLNSDTY